MAFSFRDFGVLVRLVIIWLSIGLWPFRKTTFIFLLPYPKGSSSEAQPQSWLHFLTSSSKKEIGICLGDTIMLVFLKNGKNAYKENKYIVHIYDKKERMFSSLMCIFCSCASLSSYEYSLLEGLHKMM